MLYGEIEPWIERHANYLETELFHCRSAEIPGGSHNSHVDNPDFIIESIRRFLLEEVGLD